MSSLAIQAKETDWLDQLRCGLTIRQIADSAGVKVRRIQLGIARARKRATQRYREYLSTHPRRGPQLVLHFPCQPFTPQSACPHYGPYPEGSRLCCAVCALTGIEDHPALFRDLRTEPKLEPKLPEKPKPCLTRKEKRRLRFQDRTDLPLPNRKSGNEDFP